jgi:lipoprotein-releasing system permease protein
LPYEAFLALRYLRFHRGRTFLSVITLISALGVTVGTAALVIALSLMAGFVEDVRARIHSGSAHLTVMSVEHTLFREGAEVARAVRETEGVAEAAPVIYTPAMLMLAGGAAPRYAELQGIEPGRHARVILEPDAAENPFLLLGAVTESGREPILLGEELARRMGAIEGDQLRVLVPEITLSPWSPVPRSRVFEVVGTYSSDHFQEDSQRAYVPLASADKLLHAEGRSSWIEVRLDDLRRLEPMKSRLREELGSAWLVVDLIEQNDDLLRALKTEKLMLFLAIGLIVAVAALNIVSTLILMVADKVKEIGTLAAMGARPAGVAAVFMLQGLVIGVAGTVTGLVLGFVTAVLLDRYRVIRLDPEVYYLTHVPFSPRPTDLVFVAVVALAISFLATIYPALKAARLDPVEAIRHE